MSLNQSALRLFCSCSAALKVRHQPSKRAEDAARVLSVYMRVWHQFILTITPEMDSQRSLHITCRCFITSAYIHSLFQNLFWWDFYLFTHNVSVRHQLNLSGQIMFSRTHCLGAKTMWTLLISSSNCISFYLFHCSWLSVNQVGFKCQFKSMNNTQPIADNNRKYKKTQKTQNTWKYLLTNMVIYMYKVKQIYSTKVMIFFEGQGDFRRE